MMNLFNKIVNGVKTVGKAIFSTAYEVGKKVVNTIINVAKETVKVAGYVVESAADLAQKAVKKAASVAKNFINGIKNFKIALKNGKIEWEFLWEKIGNNKFPEQTETIESSKETINPQIELIKHIELVCEKLNEYQSHGIQILEDYARLNLSRKFIEDLKHKILYNPDRLNESDLAFLNLIFDFIQGEITDSDLYLFEEEVQKRFQRSLREFGLERINYVWTDRLLRLKQELDILQNNKRSLKLQIRESEIKLENNIKLLPEEEKMLSINKPKLMNIEAQILSSEIKIIEIEKITCIIEGLLEIESKSSNIPYRISKLFEPVSSALVKWEQDLILSDEDRKYLNLFAGYFYEKLLEHQSELENEKNQFLQN